MTLDYRLKNNGIRMASEWHPNTRQELGPKEIMHLVLPVYNRSQNGRIQSDTASPVRFTYLYYRQTSRHFRSRRSHSPEMDTFSAILKIDGLSLTE